MISAERKLAEKVLDALDRNSFSPYLFATRIRMASNYAQSIMLNLVLTLIEVWAEEFHSVELTDQNINTLTVARRLQDEIDRWNNNED